MKRTGFATIPAQPHYWLADGRAQACLVDGEAPGAPDFEGLVRLDIEIRDGRIARLAPRGSAPAGAIDLKGGLVWPGFVDIHTHLDKGHIWPRSPNPDGSFLGAASMTSSDRAARWTKEDIRQRMEFGLHCAWAQGSVALRTHLDSHAPQAEISWPVFVALRDAWAGRIELQAASLMPMDAFAEPQGERLANIVATSICGTGMKPETVRALEELGRIRLSSLFFMRAFLYSEIANFYGVPNIPENTDLAVELGKRLCEELLEPLDATFSRIAIRSAYRSPTVNASGNQKGHNCASNERNHAGHIWDHLASNGCKGARACVVLPWIADRHAEGADWRSLA